MCVDFMTKLPQVGDLNQVTIVTDKATKLVTLFALSDKHKAEDVADLFFDHVICERGSAEISHLGQRSETYQRSIPADMQKMGYTSEAHYELSSPSRWSK